MLINRIDLKKSVEKILEEQAKYYDPLKKPEDKKRILDIIFGQRTSEDGPGIREYVKNEKKIYSGYNIKTLLKTGKRSEDGSLVGFRSSLIGDLYNACCEVSKLKFSNNTSKKEFYKFFLKAYLNPDSGYYVKTPSKTLSNFEIYSFDFKEFIKQNNNNSITNIETKIVEKDSVKSKGLVEYINESIKITFLNLIFNINKHNNNNKKNLKKVSSKQIFSETKNACFYISVILHEFYTPQKIFNIFMNNKELEKREKTLYKKIKDSLELNIVKNMLFKNKTEVERLKNIIFLKDILKPRIGMCNKSFKEMQDNINEFIEGKSVYDGYYNNKQIFSQFEKKPLIIVSQNKQKIQEELIIQDKYRKLNNAFFKKNKMHVIEEREEIKIEIIKTSE